MKRAVKKKEERKTHSRKHKYYGWIILCIALVAIVAVVLIISNNKNMKIKEEIQGKTHVVNITLYGFSPLVLNINKGDKVTFVNYDKLDRWPASNTHPTHTLYPNSGIDKCGTSEETKIFDSCHGLKTGETYSFVFNEAGTWRYHDHLRPSFTGTVNVS